MATTVPIKKITVATTLRNEFWNLLTFSKKGNVNKPMGNQKKKKTQNTKHKTQNKTLCRLKKNFLYCNLKKIQIHFSLLNYY